MICLPGVPDVGNNGNTGCADYRLSCSAIFYGLLYFYVIRVFFLLPEMYVMRTGLLIISVAFLFGACKKQVSQTVPVTLPEMNTLHFNNAVAGQQQPKAVDLDGDGVTDILFSFLLVGDPLMPADKYQFYVSGAFQTDFPVNSGEEMPSLQKGDMISAAAFPQHQWYNASAILLAQKVVTNTQPPYWTGAWKDCSHGYFPFRIHKDGKQFYGWFEISFDTTSEKIILHNAAVARVPGTAVKAGY